MLTHFALVLHACLTGHSAAVPAPIPVPGEELFQNVAQVQWLEFDLLKERLRELLRADDTSEIEPQEPVYCKHVLGSQHVFATLQKSLNVLFRLYRRKPRTPAVEVTFIDAAEKIAEYYLGSRPQPSENPSDGQSDTPAETDPDPNP